jgi:VCBS repeat-containing protein
MTTTVNTINGNEGNNRLTGTSRNDVINGNGGNDKLSGGAGDDTLNGGAGKDELNGGSGNDVLDGGSGSDELEGGSGNDTLIYTLAENNVIGRNTYDEYEGGSGTDTLELRFTRAEWMNEDNQKMLQSYLKWASKSGSGCRWDDDFSFKFGNARLEIEDIEKLVVKVDGDEIINAGKNGVTVVHDEITITEDEVGIQTIKVLDNDIVWDLVKNLELVTNQTSGTVKLVKPSADDASTWFFEYTPDSTVYQSLNAGDTAKETFTYRVTDANGDANKDPNKDPATVTINITGLNDAAIISGKTSGSVTEDGSDANGDSNNNGGSPIATGRLTSSIANNGNPFIPVGNQFTTYGKFSITSSGEWEYTLDNTNNTVNALNAVKYSDIEISLTDSFKIYATDNTEQIIEITINGANDAAIIGDPPLNQVTEDTNVPRNGTFVIDKYLSIRDVDNESRFITGFIFEQRSIGSFFFSSQGQYIYQVKNNLIQFLSEGQQLTESFTVRAVDGTPKTFSFTTTGVNDAAEIAGEVIGTVTESGSSNDGDSSTTTGKLTINDIDNSENSFKSEENKITTYGKFSITAEGEWTYLLNNDNETINKLNLNSVALKDTFTIKSIDDTPQIITITINGTNDAALIGGATTGSVTEDDSSFEDGRPKATGSLTARDKDNDPNIFQDVTDQESIYGYGTYSITKDGMWTYSLFNNIDGVGEVEVNSGDIVQDSFTIMSFDGTPQIITITINGADREVISDPEITELKEDEGDTDLGTIDLEGKLTINVGATQLVDPFKEEVTFSPDNIGSINFSADGSYKYSINNNNI